jgi:hypothetical protein
MKDISSCGNCDDHGCEYFNEKMELNCSYSSDNTKCVKKEIADARLALMDEMAEALNYIRTSYMAGYALIDTTKLDSLLIRYEESKK